jgi:hypothetical protein
VISIEMSSWVQEWLRSFDISGYVEEKTQSAITSAEKEMDTR